MILGAAVGQATMGSRVGRKAALWGAVFGTLPDLDVLIPMANEVAAYTYHRGFSHSLFFAAAISPVLGWLVHKLPGHRDVSSWRWVVLVWLVWSTHALLDACTTYGTQLWWPLASPPVAWNAIFIIDPLYTVPLAAGLLLTLASGGTRLRPNHLGLALSTAYLGWAFVAKVQIEHQVTDQYGAVPAAKYMSSPMPFNTLLWRVLIMEDQGYKEAFVSIFDGPDSFTAKTYSSAPLASRELESLWAFRRLRWFTQGFMRITETDGVIRITDLRMGQQDNYLFNFDIAQRSPSGFQESLADQPSVPEFQIPEDAFSALWERVWSTCPAPFRDTWRRPPLANIFSCEAR